MDYIYLGEISFEIHCEEHSFHKILGYTECVKYKDGRFSYRKFYGCDECNNSQTCIDCINKINKILMQGKELNFDNLF